MHDGLPVGELGASATHDVAVMTTRRDVRARLEMLLEVKELLDGSLEPEVVSDRLASFLVPRVADVSVLDLIESDGSIGAAAVAHVDPTMVALGQSLRGRYLAQTNPRGGPRHVMATGESELNTEVTDDIWVLLAEDEAHLADLRVFGVRSSMIVPARVRGRTIGALTLALTRSDERYDEEDRSFAEAIAARAALAIDNARLYRAERDARLRAEEVAARLRRLQEVTSSLSEAMTPDRVTEIILSNAIAAHTAPKGIVSVLSDDGRALECLAHRGYESPPMARRILLDAPLAIASAFRTGRPEVCESSEAYAARFPHSSGRCEALVAVPIVASGGRSIGAFVIGFDEPRRFTAEERVYLETLGKQGGLALERARLHEAEHRARVHAEEANRVKDEFLSVVSHELRTPLNAILGWATLLAGKAEPGTPFDKGVRVIERNARAQAKIIDDILDVSRIITGKLRLDLGRVDLASVLRASIEVVRPSADFKGVALAVSLPDGLPVVAGDPARLGQVFWNLLSNAVKFTPAGGRVDVAVEARAGMVIATFTDTGDGIDPRFLPYVFERFRQADASAARRYGGLGLGLAIVRHVVELHGGEVLAESAGVGLGARFTMSLPLPPTAAVVRSACVSDSWRHADLVAPPLDGLRVLVADDEPDAREVIAAVLTDRGAVVHVVGSAQAALDALDTFAPDVLLSDIGMPDEDGYALLKRAREHGSPRARIPAVALTAFARGADAVRAADAGFAAHLPKPVEPNLLSVVLLSAAGRLPPRG